MRKEMMGIGFLERLIGQEVPGQLQIGLLIAVILPKAGRKAVAVLWKEAAAFLA